MRLHGTLFAAIVLTLTACADGDGGSRWIATDDTGEALESARNAEQRSYIRRSISAGARRMEEGSTLSHADRAQRVTNYGSDEPGSQVARRYHRDAHPKTTGCAIGEFAVADDLPVDLHHGIFTPGRRYDAWVRFSNGNAIIQADREKDARGLAIKVLGVEGEHFTLPYDGAARNQDFLLINHPVFFVKNLGQFADFTERRSTGDEFGYFIHNQRWSQMRIGIETLGTANSPLEEDYFSMTPYAWAGGSAVKYRARACPTGWQVRRGADLTDPNFLSARLGDYLRSRDACFEFQVQRQVDPARQPIDDATVRWTTPFETVATLTLPEQDIDEDGRFAFCDDLTFNPWRGLTAHEPLGDINRGRLHVYEELSLLRHARNTDAAGGDAAVEQRFEPTGPCMARACERASAAPAGDSAGDSAPTG